MHRNQHGNHSLFPIYGSFRSRKESKAKQGQVDGLSQCGAIFVGWVWILSESQKWKECNTRGGESQEGLGRDPQGGIPGLVKSGKPRKVLRGWRGVELRG